MQVFTRFLVKQSPTLQLPSHGHGWLELPNGQRWQPAASKVQFLSGRNKPAVKPKRRPWWFRLMGLRGLAWKHQHLNG
ncbi:DUF2724 domain-containing protein [Ewingella americana]|uniref:Protein of uncharacterized function (DUF2724) n=1 Tax=Ewingella americana TaxID=41202 RepID=A0A377N809_9GAMM|nr:phage filamentation protein Fil family protein [Ewingella americana]KAA8727569.1 DUF2724 domain-containing protein [Ewingella americana]STQ42849.1 Protein of uncharacterised function (DUF2724) [Ewingella americana]